MNLKEKPVSGLFCTHDISLLLCVCLNDFVCSSVRTNGFVFMVVVVVTVLLASQRAGGVRGRGLEQDKQGRRGMERMFGLLRPSRN